MMRLASGLKLDRCIFDCQSLLVSTKGPITFDGAVFRKHVMITLQGDVDSIMLFRHATFEHGVHFRVNSFHLLSLEAAKIHESFLSAPDSHQTTENWPSLNFSKAEFGGMFLMRKCTIRGANFTDASFDAECSFESCEFNGIMAFSKARFRGETSFENCVFKSSSSFKDATFGRAPNFHNAELHQGTTFSPAHRFPLLFLDTKSESAAEYYRTLKLAMNKQHALSEEAGFFLLEMRSRARTEPFVRRAFHSAYDVLSAYGQSVRKPLAWFFGLNIVFGLLYSWLAGLEWGWWQWSPRLVLLTLHGSVPFVGGLRSPELAVATAEPLFEGFELIIVQLALVAQTTISTVLLFLVGLGLRNMFKIR